MTAAHRLLLSLALWVSLTPASLLADDTLDSPTVSPTELLEQAWKLTERGYYDKALLRKKGWSAILERYRARARSVLGREETHALINSMLGELKTSHLALVDGKVYDRYLMGEFRDKPSPRLGVEFVELPDGLYADSLLEGGPAERSGLRRGDRVLRIDGLPAIDNEDLRGAGHDPGLPGYPGYVMLVDAGQRVRLVVQAEPSGPTRELVVTARPIHMIQAIANSVRVVEVDGLRIGTIHLWHFMSERVVDHLVAALRGPLRDADGLLLDIRGRGGSTRVVNQIFNCFSGRRRLWSKPVVVLQHDHSRSAKEIFSWRWKKQRGLGPIVGQTTQGACIGTVFRPLKDGSYMLVPAIGVTRLTGGVEIEGRGIDPDIFVDVPALPFSAGRDVIFERGVQEILPFLRPARRVTPSRRPRARLY